MQNFEYSQPTNIIFGKDTQCSAGVHVKEIGNNVLIVYGSNRVRENGLMDTIEKSLKENDVSYTFLGGIKPNPVLSKVNEGIRICKEKDIDSILAVGGGSAIDTAKAIALGASSEKNVWDFYTEKALPEKALPIGTVLTIAAAGSEASTGSVITDEETKHKLAVNHKCLIPRFSILNPELTISVPAYQTACGGVDMIMHVLERYFTPTKNVVLGDRLCEAVVMAVITELPVALKAPSDYNARAEIMWAGTIAHNNLLNTGRIGDWASHSLGHEISALYDLAHGATLSIVFPAWMSYVYKNDLDRFAMFAERIMGVDATVLSKEEMALKGIADLKTLFASWGMPTSFSEVGIDDSRFDEMAEKAVSMGQPGHFVKLSKEDIINIYKLAL